MKVELVIVVDRSGSMSSKKTAATLGVNELIQSQKNQEGYCRLTLVEFDEEFNLVYSGDVKNAPEYKLVPRNMTRLNDAIGKTIDEVTKRITKTGKKYRPSTVLFNVVTDGHENDSRKYTTKQVSSMIQECKDKGWLFSYLCNDYGSELYGKQLGFNSSFTFNSTKYKEAYSAVGAKTLRVRKAVMQGASKEVIKESNEFTMAEKEVMR